jgi:hypothetical protein
MLRRVLFYMWREERQVDVIHKAGFSVWNPKDCFHPIGRSAQAAACKAAEAGAIPARDSILSGIGVERHTPVFQTGIQGALPWCSTILRDANTGAGQDVTGLAAAVQLRLRVANGLQALQRCSGLLHRRARGSTLATHHFADVAQ